MFTSKQQLHKEMGVDPDIAAFFVDRNVPVANQYWKGRYLYVARGTGYLFIPLFFDLQLRAGMDKNEILGESYVSVMENILDIAARYEFGEFDFDEHIRKIQLMIAPQVNQPWLWTELNNYFSSQPLRASGMLGSDNPAQNRGDALLYLLCTSTASKEVVEKAIRYWYLLVPSFLLLDDIMDFQEDREKMEENALSYYGYDVAGIRKGVNAVEVNFRELEKTNPVLGAFFKSTLEQKKQTPYFQQILKD